MNAPRAQNHPMSWLRTLQRKLYRVAKQSSGRKFGIIHNHVCNPRTLKEAWKRVSANGGAPGVDRQTIAEIKAAGVDEFLAELQNELENDQYLPNVIRRVYVPKGTSGKRPLGIPTLKDRVTQMAVKLIIEPLFEADFLDCSLGFRPRRNNKEAAQLVHRYSNTHKWVVDVDLKSYFDTIDHDALMELVRRRVSDKRILWLIKQWLKAGILEDGIVTTPERGTPQGGVLSPLLSNIYLNEIDKLWHGNASVKLVRFADDMVLLCKSETQARWVLKTLKGQLEALKLTLNEEKTKIRHVRETFDFVGFTYREAFSKKQGRLIRIKYPRAKSMQKIRDKIKSAVKEIPTGKELSEVITEVNRKLRGWAEYFKAGNSYEAALEITEFACKQLRIFWRRHKNRKEQQCSQIWQNKFFYERGLLYVPYLLKN